MFNKKFCPFNIENKIIYCHFCKENTHFFKECPFSNGVNWYKDFVV